MCDNVHKYPPGRQVFDRDRDRVVAKVLHREERLELGAIEAELVESTIQKGVGGIVQY